MKRPLYIWASSVLVIAALALASCTTTATPASVAPPAPQSSPVSAKDAAAETLEKARQEGKVVWYAGLETTTMEKIRDAFQKKTGIETEAIRLGGEQVFTRVLQEAKVGLKVADIVYTGSEGHFQTFKDQGLLAKYTSTENAAVRPEFADKDGYYYVPYTNRFIMAYNPKVLPAAQAPKKWSDLADPKWKGKLVIPHPAYSVGASVIPYFWAKQFGWDFVDKVAKNDPLIVQSIHDGAVAVISGERQVITAIGYGDVFQEQTLGNPIEIINQEEGIPIYNAGVAVLKDAPHPNAGRALLDYILSQEGQQLIADLNRDAVRDDVKYKPGLVPSKGQKLLPLNPLDLANSLEEIKDRFRQYFGV